MLRPLIIVGTTFIFALIGLWVGYLETRDIAMFTFIGGFCGLFVGGIAQNFVTQNQPPTNTQNGSN